MVKLKIKKKTNGNKSKTQKQLRKKTPEKQFIKKLILRNLKQNNVIKYDFVHKKWINCPINVDATKHYNNINNTGNNSTTNNNNTDNNPETSVSLKRENFDVVLNKKLVAFFGKNLIPPNLTRKKKRYQINVSILLKSPSKNPIKLSLLRKKRSQEKLGKHKKINVFAGKTITRSFIARMKMKDALEFNLGATSKREISFNFRFVILTIVPYLGSSEESEVEEPEVEEPEVEEPEVEEPEVEEPEVEEPEVEEPEVEEPEVEEPEVEEPEVEEPEVEEPEVEEPEVEEPEVEEPEVEEPEIEEPEVEEPEVEEPEIGEP